MEASIYFHGSLHLLPDYLEVAAAASTEVTAAASMEATNYFHLNTSGLLLSTFFHGRSIIYLRLGLPLLMFFFSRAAFMGHDATRGSGQEVF